MSIDLTLQRLHVLLSHLPPYRRPTCHIAGTNGKGSVSAILSSILLASSPPLSVGRFNSPHLVSVLDSIVINNRPVTAGVYAEARSKVEKVDKQHGVGASSFELLTSTALMIFEKAVLDIVVMEVGMGGRLDATNAISDECVAVSALTAVDLDHQAFLGGSVEAIAREKAAIARKGKPFVLGGQNHAAVDEVARSLVAELGGDLVSSTDAVRRNSGESIGTLLQPSSQSVTVFMPCFEQPVLAKLPLHGDHQLANLGIATTMASQLLTHPACAHLGLRSRITPVTVATGIESTSWPGRLSFHSYIASNGNKITVLADGAHNRASAQTLSIYISSMLSRRAADSEFNLTYVLALSHSPPKTPRDTLEPLLATCPPHVSVNVAAVGFSPPEGMPWIRSVPPTEIVQVVTDLNTSINSYHNSGEGGIVDALDWAASVTGKDGLIVVAGSLYLVADFYRTLQ